MRVRLELTPMQAVRHYGGLMSPNTKKWLKGALSASIGAAAGAFASTVLAPEILQQLGWIPVLKISAASGAIAVANYLKKSPLPEDE